MPRPCAGCAVDARAAAHVLEAVLDQRDVLEVDRRAGHLAHDDVAQRLEVERLAEHAHVDLAALGLEAAGRAARRARAAGRAITSRDGQAALVEPGGVDPDADVALERSRPC